MTGYRKGIAIMKSDRHATIIDIISNHNVETQEELASLLREQGYDVTQATVSRDIRQLNLTKASLSNGHQKYVLANTQAHHLSRYERILKDAFVSAETAGNLLVIKTISGMAMAMGAALDELHLDQFVGCISGDDTVMAAFTTEDGARQARETIRKLAF